MTLLETEHRSKPSTRSMSIGAIATIAAALGAIAVIVVTALTTGGSPNLPEGALFTTGDDGSVSLFDTDTGAWVYQVPDAALAHDRSTLFQAAAVDDETVLTAFDPVTAEEMQAQRIPGELQIRVVSPQGDAVALMEPRTTTGLYVPERRDSTDIYVARTDGTTWRRYVLEGNYEPEAFSVNTQTLFLLKFLPADNPDHYEVHRLDLETGAVINDYTPEVGLDTWMKGHARAQVTAPDGRFLYTLYSLDEGEDPIKDPALENSPDYHAFVHVISLEEEWSFCIFLPMRFGQQNVDSIGLAVSPDGSALAAVDKRTGVLVEIDTAKLEISRHNIIGQYPEAEGPVPMAIDPAGTIYLADGGYVSSLEPENRNYGAGMETAGIVRSMDLSDNGQFLRVAVPDRIHVIDLSTGEEAGSLVLPNAANQVILGPATRTKFEVFTCAC
jgi:hypothetical protein